MATISDRQVIAAIRKTHLKANITDVPARRLDWKRAWVDVGGTIFGPGPYVKVPVRDGRVIRVYAPERVRRRLARDWKRGA